MVNNILSRRKEYSGIMIRTCRACKGEMDCHRYNWEGKDCWEQFKCEDCQQTVKLRIVKIRDSYAAVEVEWD